MMNRNATLIIVLAISHGVLAGIFDSIVSYRYGTNLETELSSERYEYEDVPPAPSSVDSAYAHTISSTDQIHVVHCYSMREGLEGTVTSATVIWSELSFEPPDEMRIGSAQDIKKVSFPIDGKIQQFTVRETDMTAFALGSTTLNDMSLHVLPFHEVTDGNIVIKPQTYKLSISQSLGVYLNILTDLLHVPGEPEKLLFYSLNFVGEIILSE